MSTWPVKSSRGCGWSNSASIARGKTSFDKTNFRSWGVSPKFHKKLRQHNWRTSCPSLKWCLSWFWIMVASTEFSFLLVKITGTSSSLIYFHQMNATLVNAVLYPCYFKNNFSEVNFWENYLLLDSLLTTSFEWKHELPFPWVPKTVGNIKKDGKHLKST